MSLNIRVGLIADTQGLLRPEATAFLLGSDHIVHAGDIGGGARDIGGGGTLSRHYAPSLGVSAVRGNNDREPQAA